MKQSGFPDGVCGCVCIFLYGYSRNIPYVGEVRGRSYPVVLEKYVGALGRDASSTGMIAGGFLTEAVQKSL